ncbi:hypothetical integrase (fragment) protein [Xanthomonas albilineans GPE PC73]|uniref:Hypothetical integrase protein n=1 Tax=Xanthomonas albilineans (strain GPE PC73 / CFBP 7063) TaxID=380358 RepID=D2U979_XANAP
MVTMTGFVDLDDARQWAMGFVQWYNVQYRSAASATSAPRSGMLGMTWQSYRRAMRRTAKRVRPARHAGAASRATGSWLPRWR